MSTHELHERVGESVWDRRRIHQAIEELPEHQRELIALAYWSGLSAPEIATHLNLPLRIVQTRMRGTLSELSRLLGRKLLRV